MFCYFEIYYDYKTYLKINCWTKILKMLDVGQRRGKIEISFRMLTILLPLAAMVNHIPSLPTMCIRFHIKAVPHSCPFESIFLFSTINCLFSYEM